MSSWQASTHAIALAQKVYEEMKRTGLSDAWASRMLEIIDISPNTTLSTLVGLENALGIKIIDVEVSK